MIAATQAGFNSLAAFTEITQKFIVERWFVYQDF